MAEVDGAVEAVGDGLTAKWARPSVRVKDRSRLACRAGDGRYTPSASFDGAVAEDASWRGKVLPLGTASQAESVEFYFGHVDKLEGVCVV